MRKLALLILVGALSNAALSAAGFKVVANSSVGASSIGVEDLKRVFLATRTTLDDGSRVEPVLLKRGAAHAAFLTELGKSDTALQTYYRSLVFTGKGSMPKVLDADVDVIGYVAKTKGAIGYVSTEVATAGVKVLELR